MHIAKGPNDKQSVLSPPFEIDFIFLTKFSNSMYLNSFLFVIEDEIEHFYPPCL